MTQKILILVGPDYEDLELWYPKLRLEEAGYQALMAGLEEPGTLYAGKHGYPCRSEARVADQDPAAFAGVVCPGGWAPDKLRRDPAVLDFVKAVDASGKMVAAICHGGWVPASAGVYQGVKLTGSPGIKDDMIHAGAHWEDAPLVVDRHFVSSRKPDDLPEFAKGMLQVLGR